MELLELKNKTLKIFGSTIDDLGESLMRAIKTDDARIYEQFCNLIENDLTVDWLQMVYQYYLADRKEKKQDYTPRCLAIFLNRLIGDCDLVVDMCAGSGALTIQKWKEKPDQEFLLYEIDKTVMPFLLFNLVIRNIQANVYRADVLSGETFEHYVVKKGEKYGKVTCVKSAV